MKKWNAELQFPTDSGYTNRIVGATFGPSSKENPMITLDTEVVTPAEAEINGEQVNIAGVKAKYYITVGVTDNPEKDAVVKENAKKNLTELFGMKEVNLDNPDLSQLRGKLILTLMSASMEERRKNPTAAQIEAAKAKGVRPQGDILKHPKTGKALVQYWPRIDEVFGLAPVQDGVQVPY